MSDAALRRYAHRMRPWRIAYAVVLVVAAIVLVVIAKIAYSVGEISHVTLRTVRYPPPGVTLRPPAATQTQAWRSGDSTALGTPYAGGTIITYDKHSVRGRDSRTGKITWSYTRTDRSVCTALQTDDVTVAVYELHGNCDELTGLDSDTGERQWTRTLDKDSNVVNHAVEGQPHYAVTDSTVLIWTAQVIYAIDPSGNQDFGSKNGGLDHWVFGEQGCTINGVALGSSGALISQTCRARHCSGLKFCGNGPQLLLRDPLTGENTNSSTNDGNPDQIKWNRIGSNLRPASADNTVTALSPDGTTLFRLKTESGKIAGDLALSGGSGAVSVAATGDGDLVRFGGMTYAMRTGFPAFIWQAETAALPTVSSANGVGLPELPATRLTVPTATGIATLDPTDGTVKQRFAVPATAAGSVVYPYGTGFLVAGPDTVLYR